MIARKSHSNIWKKSKYVFGVRGRDRVKQKIERGESERRKETNRDR